MGAVVRWWAVGDSLILMLQQGFEEICSGVLSQDCFSGRTVISISLSMQGEVPAFL